MTRDWDIVSSYIDKVGTIDTVIPFAKTQDSVRIKNQGNANLIYTIGSQSGTLSPGQSIKVSESINSFTLRSASGTQAYEVLATEAGTEKEDPVTDISSQITNITSQLAQKATKAELANIGNGSPKGTYATLTALQTAFPTGTTGIYLVTADGKWYYWNGSAWVAGGVYQATGLAAGSVTKSTLASNVADGRSLLSATNLCDELNNTPIIGYTNFADTVNMKSNVALGTDGYVHYKVYSDVVNAGGYNAWMLQKKYTFTTSDIFVFDYSATVNLQVQIYVRDSANNNIDTKNIQLTGSGTYLFTTALTNAAYLVINAVQYNTTAIGSVEVSNLRIHSKTDYNLGVNLTEKIGIMKNDITANKSGIKHITYPFSTYSNTIGNVSEEVYKVKNSKKSFKWSVPNGSTGSITFSGLNILCNETDTIGIWIYMSKNVTDRYLNTDGTFSVTINDTYVASSINTAYKYHNGWNYVSFKPTLTKIISIKVAFSLVRADYVLYFDSVEINYKNKPKVLLAFDNCVSNLTDTIYPLLDSYGFRGTFALQSGYVPDNVTSGYLSKTQFNTLMSKNWDFAIYSGLGTRAGDTQQNWADFLQAYLTALEGVGIFNPICYFSPNNQSDAIRMAAEKQVGYRMNRSMIANDCNLIDYFDRDSFETTAIGITTDNTAVKTAIDMAISDGKSLCIFTHQILTVGDSLSATQSVYVDMLNYLKTKVDTGAVDVITYREFYQLYEPSDYENYINQRRAKQYNYIQSKMGI